MSYYAHTLPRKAVRHPHIRHAITRAEARYGLAAPTVLMLDEMVRKHQGIKRSVRQTTTRTLHEVELMGNSYFVVFSKSTGHIVTFLTQEMGQRHHFEDDTPRCICGAMLAQVRDRQVCTVHPELNQEEK